MSVSILIGIGLAGLSLFVVMVLGVFIWSHRRRAAGKPFIDPMADFGLPSDSGAKPVATAALKTAVALHELDAVASVPDGISADKQADAGVADQPSVESTSLARTELDALREQLECDREAFAKQQVATDEALGAREMKVSERETATQKREEALTQSEADEKERVTMLTQFEGTLMSREAAVKLREDASATAEVVARDRAMKIEWRETAVKAREDAVTKAEAAVKLREGAATRAETAVKHHEIMLAKAEVTMKDRETKAKAREDAATNAEAAVKLREDAIGMAAEVMKEREDALATAEVALKEREAVVGDAVIAAEAKLATAGQLFDDLDQREADLKQREAVAQREQVSTIPSKDKPEDQPLTRGAKIFLVLVGLAGLAVVGGFAYFLFF